MGLKAFCDAGHLMCIRYFIHEQHANYNFNIRIISRCDNKNERITIWKWVKVFRMWEILSSRLRNGQWEKINFRRMHEASYIHRHDARAVTKLLQFAVHFCYALIGSRKGFHSILLILIKPTKLNENYLISNYIEFDITTAVIIKH